MKAEQEELIPTAVKAEQMELIPTAVKAEQKELIPTAVTENKAYPNGCEGEREPKHRNVFCKKRLAML